MNMIQNKRLFLGMFCLQVHIKACSHLFWLDIPGRIRDARRAKTRFWPDLPARLPRPPAAARGRRRPRSRRHQRVHAHVGPQRLLRGRYQNRPRGWPPSRRRRSRRPTRCCSGSPRGWARGCWSTTWRCFCAVEARPPARLASAWKVTTCCCRSCSWWSTYTIYLFGSVDGGEASLNLYDFLEYLVVCFCARNSYNLIMSRKAILPLDTPAPNLCWQPRFQWWIFSRGGSINI